MRAAETSRDSNQKLFASFFQKRSACLSSLVLCALSGPAVAGGVGSLSNDQAYALSAYILAQAHILPENAVPDAKTLPQVRMPNRKGFVPDRTTAIET